MDGKEKLRESEIKLGSERSKWLENFWYHYKWPTIIVSFFVIVFLVCTLQMCTKEEEDFTVLYAGPAYLSSEDTSGIEDVMNFIMTESLGENGSNKTGLVSYHIMSKAQILAAEENGSYVDRSYNTTNNDNYYDYIMTGETSVCILDPELYANLVSNERLMKLDEALGYHCEDSEDGYGIKLSSLDIYEAYGAIKKLPEDSVVCVLRPPLFGRTSKDANFKKDMEMFGAILNFNAE
ncbi:MAG: hypothetical protein E7641_05805 [Ruminococcaceae bacterium]|nr:hypothetical protein [Oscillospiraceae bacterium]